MIYEVRSTEYVVLAIMGPGIMPIAGVVDAGALFQFAVLSLQPLFGTGQKVPPADGPVTLASSVVTRKFKMALEMELAPTPVTVNLKRISLAGLPSRLRFPVETLVGESDLIYVSSVGVKVSVDGAALPTVTPTPADSVEFPAKSRTTAVKV